MPQPLVDKMTHEIKRTLPYPYVDMYMNDKNVTDSLVALIT